MLPTSCIIVISRGSFFLMRNVGLEPTRPAAQEPKSCMSANSINSARASLCYHHTWQKSMHFYFFDIEFISLHKVGMFTAAMRADLPILYSRIGLLTILAIRDRRQCFHHQFTFTEQRPLFCGPCSHISSKIRSSTG